MPASRPTANLSRRTALQFGAGGLATALLQTQRGRASAQTPSPIDANKALVLRLFEEAVNNGDEKTVSTLYALVPVTANSEAIEMPAVAGMPVSLQEFRRMAPDVLATVDTLIAEADMVAARVTWRGTHPPAGTHIEGHTMHGFRIEQDHIVEQWSAGWDWLEDRREQPGCAPANPLMTL